MEGGLQGHFPFPGTSPKRVLAGSSFHEFNFKGTSTMKELVKFQSRQSIRPRRPRRVRTLGLLALLTAPMSGLIGAGRRTRRARMAA